MLKDRRHGCPKAIRMTSDWRAPLSFTTMPLKSWPACCAVSDRTWLAPRCWETACCTRSRSILRRTDGCAKPISWTIQTRLERLSFPPVSPSSSRAALREIWHGREWRSRNWRIARELRSEEHTSELQSRFDLVCRFLLEKKRHSTKLDCKNS